MGMIDLKGQRFGRLAVIGRAADHITKSGTKQIQWLCVCDCGKETIVRGCALRSGHTKSCGCLYSEDLTGKRFGQLTVIRPCGSNNNRLKRYLCKCDCGNKKLVDGNSLRSGDTKSCGCGRLKYSDRVSNHGDSGTRLYKVWLMMKDRCFNTNSENYIHYGGRGITICEEWLDFEKFRAWALSTGYDENAEYGKYTIEREDVNGNYEPDNCKWIPMSEQNSNKRNNCIVEINGIKKTFSEWCREYGISYTTAASRKNRGGWDVVSAITTPVGAKRII